MLHVVTWIWGDKYGLEDIRKLKAGVTRHLEQQHTFLVARPPPEDDLLTTIKGCFCRLRMFDPQWQASMGIQDGDRIVCMDLDIVIVGSLDPLFNRAERFTILQGANAANPCPFNGSLMMLRAGAHPEVWSDFSIGQALLIPFFEFPDDQGWLHHKLPNASGWKVGAPSGVYAFQKPGWPKGDALPHDARMVVFPGWRSPSRFTHLSWVKQYWSEAISERRKADA